MGSTDLPSKGVSLLPTMNSEEAKIAARLRVAPKEMCDSIPAFSRPCRFVYSAADPKPKRRLFDVLKSQGPQTNQEVTFLTDGVRKSVR